jgi:glycosyltransferase involved in cell wall biosynthesis
MNRVSKFVRYRAEKLEKYIFLNNRYVIEKEIERDNLQQEKFHIPDDKKLKVVQYIGTLGPGGSERQLCNLAIKLSEMDMNVTVLTCCDLEGELSHYLPYLTTHGIPARMAEQADIESIMNKSRDNQYFNEYVLKASPPYLANYIFALVKELMIIKPDILHCWLDYCNVVGGIAGIITGVPKILFSGRNVNPTNFPLMDRPWFKDWYKVLIKSRRVFFTNNSKAGAEDYAKWLGIEPDRIHVVYNGLEFGKLDDVKKEDVKAFRQSIGISDNMPLVGGVFRLSPEKLPFDFIEVIKRVKAELGEIKAIIAGSGVLEKEVRNSIQQNGLENTIYLLGNRDDIYTVMKACDLILLTSGNEGTPNVLLEAQYLSVPVVATNAGGIPEIVNSGVTGLLHEVGDIEGMSRSVIKILLDKQYALQLGKEGHRLTKENFSIEYMFKRNISLYFNNDYTVFNRPQKKSSLALFYLNFYLVLLTSGLFKYMFSLLKQTEKSNVVKLNPKMILKSICYKFSKKTGKQTQGKLMNINHDTGYCYIAAIPAWIISDVDGLSRLCLFEDGKPLGSAHSIHDDIRKLGNGKYSHWSNSIYFSTSDNSDPRTNGRTYSFSDSGEIKNKEELLQKNIKAATEAISREIILDNTTVVSNFFPKQKNLKIVQYIGELGPGGSERQLCNLTIKLCEIGMDVTVLTSNPIKGISAYYQPLLIERKIPLKVVQRCAMDTVIQKLPEGSISLIKKIRGSVFTSMEQDIVALVNQLIMIKPDILHCWLDYPNIAGCLAGLIAGIPKIILSTRSANPSHFPYLNDPLRKDQYKILEQSKRTVFLNNSQAGAIDYTQWLGLAPSRFKVIYNGIDFNSFKNITRDDIASFRQSIQIGENIPLIGGVFRFTAEKRPLDFLEVIQRTKEKVTNIKAIIIGTGPLEKEIKKTISKNHRDDSVILLGPRKDVLIAIKSCNVILLTSEMEGCPNILLEAQYLGIPVVASRVGGIPGIVDDGVSGLLCPVGDIDCMSESILKILSDKAYAKGLGESGHRFMSERFSIDKSAQDILKVYYNSNL